VSPLHPLSPPALVLDSMTRVFRASRPRDKTASDGDPPRSRPAFRETAVTVGSYPAVCRAGAISSPTLQFNLGVYTATSNDDLRRRVVTGGDN
jgi:hypothetical protein